MRYEERRLKYINSLMNRVNILCDNVYESLIDYDFDNVKENLNELKIEIEELTKSISNEI